MYYVVAVCPALAEIRHRLDSKSSCVDLVEHVVQWER